MATTNTPPPDALKSSVDDQTSRGGCGASSEYACVMIGHDPDRHHLRNHLLEGAASAPTGVADDGYFDGLRDRIRSLPAK